MTAFGVEDGVPRVAITDLVEGAHGRLWIGTEGGGLRRYDGRTFSVHSVSHGLASSIVRALHADGAGTLWAGTARGLSRYEGDEARTFARHATSAGGNQEVHAITESHDDSLWVATATGIVRMGQAAGRPVSVLQEVTAHALLEMRSGVLWIGTREGLFQYGRGQLRAVPLPGGVRPAVHAFARDGDTLYAATEAGLVRVASGRATWVAATEGRAVRQVLVGVDGAVWTGTVRHGVGRFDGATYATVVPPERPCGRVVSALYEERGGALWVGTEEGQLCRLDATMLAVYDGFPSSPVVAADTAGTLWLGAGRQLLRTEGGARTPVDVATLPSAANALLATPNGVVWAGTAGGDVLRWHGEDVERVASGLPAVLDVAHDGQRLWMGTLRGVYRLENGRMRADTTTTPHAIWDLFRDREGRMWLAGGLSGGVAVYDTTGRRLSLPEPLQTFPAVAVEQDAAGALWFGTNQGRGLLRYRPDAPASQIDRFMIGDGLLQNSIRFLAADASGRLWVGHTEGLSRIDSVQAARPGSAHIRTYARRALGTGPFHRNAVVLDAAGRLWFGTSTGVVRYAPSWDRHRPQPPPVAITDVRLTDRSETWKAWADSTDRQTGLPVGLRLPHNRNHLTFAFEGIDLAGAASLRYQYRLRGLTNTWSSDRREARANYANLGPGHYTFEVRAATAGSGWSAPARLSFTIVPAFWQRPVFYLVALLTLGGLVGGGMHYRTRRLQRWRAHLEQLVARRTDQLRSEKEKLEAANRELEKLSIVASGTDNIVYIADLDGRIEWVNAAFERTTGYTLEALRAEKGATLHDISSHADVQGLIDTCLRREQAVTYESTLTGRGGEPRWYSSTLSLSTDAQGTPHKLIVIDTDITERVQLERELIQAREEALSASHAKSAFLATMSHEIRTPLNGVIGMASLLERTKLSSEQKEYVDIIQSSADALLDIISDILDFSKIEADRIELEAAPVVVRAVVEEVLDTVRTRAAQKGLELAYFIDPEVPAVIESDATRLRQILTNLFSNAVKFTEEGAVTVLIDATPDDAEETTYTMRFAVEDTGIGIAPEKQAQIFEPFTQADASDTRKYGGTGLGLAISRQLCEALGGRMWVESAAGEGATFFFTIQAPAGDPAEAMVLPDEELMGTSVLIVDDNAVNRRMMAVLAKQWGMEPTVVAGGEAALQHVSDGTTFDVALLDMQMPGMDGVALAQRLAAHPAYDGFPLVMMSSVEQRRRTSEQRVDAWLTKPVKFEHLRRVVQRVLARGAEERMAAPDEPPRSPSETHRRVLLVEDDRVNRKLAHRLLQQLGYDADEAHDGREALAAFEETVYDIVLMDVQMPVMDGLEATRRIRARFGEAPYVIALTARALDGDRAECLAAGMNAYVSKPIRRAQFEAALDEAERHVQAEAGA